MIDGLNSRLDTFLLDIGRTQRRAASAQLQLTSGFRRRSAVDDPGSVNDLLRANAGLARTEQAQRNLTAVKTEVEIGSAALQSAIRLLDDAVTLGSQASSGTFGDDKRVILAAQLADLQSSVVNITSTVANGRYVFSGDLDGAPSYALDLNAPTGVTQLAVPTATIQIAHPDGSRISVGRTAQAMFDLRDASGLPAPENVFAALQTLRLAVESGTDTEVVSALVQVKSAAAYLNTQAAGYDSTLGRVMAAVSDSQTAQAQWKVQRSEIRDADIAAAILEMQLMDTQLNASMSAQAQFPRTSLFDFLG